MESLRQARLRDLTDPATSNQAYDLALIYKILIVSGIFKLLLAFSIPLTLDEAYATAVAREYSLSFFEHPPISFWMPVLAADLTGINATIVYRFPFLLVGLGITWMMFLIGREIGGSRVGVWSAVLFCAAPSPFLASGVWAVPDGPLNLASTIVVYFLVRIARFEGTAPLKLWLYAGVAMAFALASKYQAAWLPVGVLLFMLAHPVGRRWFLHPGFYLAGLIGLIGLLPVILWNAGHDWVTFRFHGDRITGGLHFGHFTGMLLVQAMYLLPTGMLVAGIGLWYGVRNRARADVFLLVFLAVGPILIFNYINLTSTASLAHWSMPGWLLAFLLAAVWLNARGAVTVRRIWRWMVGLFAVVWLVLGLLIVQSNTGWLTRPFYVRPPAWDNTISLFDFGDLKPALVKRGLWQTTDVFMANSWAYGGLLDSFMGSEKPIRIFDLNAAHHFVYLSDADALGRALFMEPSRLTDVAVTDAQTLKSARSLDPNATLLPPLTLNRGGQPYVSVSVVSLTLLQKTLALQQSLSPAQ